MPVPMRRHVSDDVGSGLERPERKPACSNHVVSNIDPKSRAFAKRRSPGADCFARGCCVVNGVGTFAQNEVERGAQNRCLQDDCDDTEKPVERDENLIWTRIALSELHNAYVSIMYYNTWYYII